MNVHNANIMIMAGGTGGHVFPALAIAAHFSERGANIIWMGTAAGIEARLVPEAGYPLETIRVAGLRGKGAVSWLGAPLRLLRAVWQARCIMRRHRPQLALGMGGFASGPGGAAAWLCRVPLVIHEQNAAAGLTNRLLARIARVVLQAFPDTFPAARDASCVGNPVRAEILALPSPQSRFANRHGRVRLLALGGSLGALAINDMLPRALARLPEAERPAVRHQAGRTLEAAQKAYRETGVEADVFEFIDDMAAAYAWADIVVCRAGALTVAELAAAGVGALLIPFPYAVDDHQSSNGMYLVERDAAVLIQQSDLDAQRLAATLRTLCADRDALLAMATRARQAAWPQATDVIASACMRAMQGAV